MAPFYPGQKLLHGILVTFSINLHRPIGEILHPTSNANLLGDPMSEVAKTHSLYPAFHDITTSNHNAERQQSVFYLSIFNAVPQRETALVGARGFEPPTSRTRTVRATKLRYAPIDQNSLIV